MCSCNVGVKMFGAVGDGVTDDTEAIKAAIAAGQTYFPPGTYYHTESLRFDRSGLVAGNNAWLKPDASLSTTGAVRADDVRFEGMGFLGTSNYVSLFLNGAYRNTVIRDCVFEGMTGVLIEGQNDVTVESCVFRSVSAVWAHQGAKRVTVKDCDISGWAEVRPALFAHDGVEDVMFTGNRLHDPAEIVEGIAVPVKIGSSGDALCRRVQVNHNTVVGVDKPYKSDVGTPDQFGFSNVEGLQVVGNTSVDGGDMGMSFSPNVSDAVVAENVCMYNEVSGIWIWGERYTLQDNVCVGNGVNRKSTTNPKHLAGIVLDDPHDRVQLAGNVCSDQTYGVSIFNESRVDFGVNDFRGNVYAEVQRFSA